MSEASINITDIIGVKPSGFKPVTGSCNFQQGRAFEIWKHLSKWPWGSKADAPQKDDVPKEQSKREG
ncbi:hypothetical protein KEM56_000114 [Ascosphaera pollenicola]|nr:hypothetical protein KEM56_000114 [Ascosphaera pollenicola]